MKKPSEMTLIFFFIVNILQQHLYLKSYLSLDEEPSQKILICIHYFLSYFIFFSTSPPSASGLQPTFIRGPALIQDR